jgi:hypothetical protein
MVGLTWTKPGFIAPPAWRRSANSNRPRSGVARRFEAYVYQYGHSHRPIRPDHGFRRRSQSLLSNAARANLNPATANNNSNAAPHPNPRDAAAGRAGYANARFACYFSAGNRY